MRVWAGWWQPAPCPLYTPLHVVHVLSDTAPLSAANCGKCGNDRAYYQQLQIRHKDDPITSFYKCAACGLRWRED